MNLQQELDQLASETMEQVSPEVKRVMRDAQRSVEEQHGASEALGEGDTIPDIVLPDATGTPVHVNGYDGPLVISFYRGEWCPYCNLELKALHDIQDDIKALGATLVAISPATPDNSLTVQEKHDLDFDVLSDEDNKVAEQFGLVVQLPDDLVELYDQMGIDLEASQGNDEHRLPIPATYVVNDDVITYEFVNPDYKKRVEPKRILAALKKL